MSKAVPWAFLLLSLVACQPQEKPPVPAGSISDNLPITDRDLLLKPLESALDDLREVILRDQSYFASSYTVENGHDRGEVKFKLDGPDTAMISASIQLPLGAEYHEVFKDEEGKTFFTFHRFEKNEGSVGVPSVREYKFYYEDSGIPLSVYARMEFDGRPLPETWTPVCLTAEEERYIKGRVKHFTGFKAR